MSREKAQTTRLLNSLVEGEPQAARDLFPLVYSELHQLAGQIVHQSPARAGLQPTELIHEAYLRLVDEAGVVDRQVESRLHFRRLAARVMHNVLIDCARADSADKRGGGKRRVTLDDDLVGRATDIDDVIEVHEGLAALTELDPQLAEIVEMRFFAGMTMPDIAAVLEISESSANRGWRLARSWWVEEFRADERPD